MSSGFGKPGLVSTSKRLFLGLRQKSHRMEVSVWLLSGVHLVAVIPRAQKPL
jgi:hypothetical protein